MSQVLYAPDDGVALITLDAYERRNALTPSMTQELVAAVERANEDSAIGAIVLSGGRSFCAGAARDMLGDMYSDPAADENFNRALDIYSAFVVVGRARVPVIAAARGAAVGAGMNLLLAADVRIVADDARLISGFLRIGSHPGGGHFSLLAQVAGPEVTAAMALCGEEISGREAVGRNLAHRAVPDDQVESVALSYARNAARDPALVRRATASFRKITEPPGTRWEAAIDIEALPQMWSHRRQHR